MLNLRAGYARRPHRIKTIDRPLRKRVGELAGAARKKRSTRNFTAARCRRSINRMKPTDPIAD
jgi:hypothetical protein